MDDYLEEHDFNELVSEVMGCLAKSLGGGEASEEDDERNLHPPGHAGPAAAGEEDGLPPVNYGDDAWHGSSDGKPGN